MTKQTKKTTTKPESKVTEQVKRPTIKSLQLEVENLTTQLLYANKKAVELQEKVFKLEDDLQNLNDMPWTIITYSRFVGWLCRITLPFKG